MVFSFNQLLNNRTTSKLELIPEHVFLKTFYFTINFDNWKGYFNIK